MIINNVFAQKFNNNDGSPRKMCKKIEIQNYGY